MNPQNLAKKIKKNLERPSGLLKSGHSRRLTGGVIEDSHRAAIALFLGQTPFRHSKKVNELYREFKSRFCARRVGDLSNGTPLTKEDPTKAITLRQFAYTVRKLLETEGSLR